MEKNIGSQQGVILALDPKGGTSKSVLVLVANGCPDNGSNPLEAIFIDGNTFALSVSSLVSGDTTVYLTIRNIINNWGT